MLILNALSRRTFYPGDHPRIDFICGEWVQKKSFDLKKVKRLEFDGGLGRERRSGKVSSLGRRHIQEAEPSPSGSLQGLETSILLCQTTLPALLFLTPTTHSPTMACGKGYQLPCENESLISEEEKQKDLQADESSSPLWSLGLHCARGFCLRRLLLPPPTRSKEPFLLLLLAWRSPR